MSLDLNSKKQWKLSPWTNTNEGGAGAMLPTGQQTNVKQTRGSTASLATHDIYDLGWMLCCQPCVTNSLGAWRKMLSNLLHALLKTSSVAMPPSTGRLHPLLCWVLWDWWCRKPNVPHHELDMVVALCRLETPGTVHLPIALLCWGLLSILAWGNIS